MAWVSSCRVRDLQWGLGSAAQEEVAARTCIFVIGGDGGHGETLKVLRRLGYFIVVVRPSNHTPLALYQSASVAESWEAIKDM